MRQYLHGNTVTNCKCQSKHFVSMPPIQLLYACNRMTHRGDSYCIALDMLHASPGKPSCCQILLAWLFLSDNSELEFLRENVITLLQQPSSCNLHSSLQRT